MNCRTSTLFLLLFSVVRCATVAMAQAPATIFQLDGNAALSPSYPTCSYGPCDYWDLLNGNGTPGSGSAGASSVRTFVSGLSSTDAFTGGGSKDFNPISSWKYSSSPTPNKDTLNAAYAAAYNFGDFDVIFGADRASPNGDANIGIWFFQNTVAPNGTGGFTGSHLKGDVFVISAFTGGGGTSGISVYEWDPACSTGVKNPTPGQCADSNLRLLANPFSVCGNSLYCGITNNATTATTWEGNLASPLFFEGGVDITQAFAAVGGALPCFSSFLVETRSSQSTSAVLKDFISGGFPVCSLQITKSCGTAAVNSDGTAINYPVNGTVTNTGIGTLANVTVFDTPGTAGGVGIFTVPVSGVCDGTGTPLTSLGAGQKACWYDSASSTATSLSDSAFATASTGSSTIQSTNTATASCALAVASTLTINKSCKTSLVVSGGAVSVQVAFGGTITNTGSAKVTGITLKDYPDADNVNGAGTALAGTFALAPGASVSYGPYSYNPTLIDQTIVGSDGIAGDGAGRYFFSDLINIQTATPSIGTLTTVSTPSDPRTNKFFGFNTASCPICQGAGECTAN